MLPDFPDLKRRTNNRLSQFIRAQVPQVAPLLSDVATYIQHEGRAGGLTREDSSYDETELKGEPFPLALSREEMKTMDGDVLRIRLIELAKQIAEYQTKLMLSRVSEAVDSVGNSVSTGGELRPEHLLEALQKVHIDFDPVTEERKPGFKWVMHPDTAKAVMAKVTEWEKDQSFQDEMERIEKKQKEDWRAREARRTLAD
jgi:hypothetical protein